MSFLEEISEIVDREEQEDFIATIRTADPGKSAIMVQKSKPSSTLPNLDNSNQVKI